VAVAVQDYNSGRTLAPDDGDIIPLCDDQHKPNGELTFTPTDDEDLKSRIITHDLISFFGIPVDWTKHAKQPPTRLELVRKLAKSELEARFQKYPNSRVAVIPFATTPEVRFDDGTAAQLWPILEKLEQGLGGGTDILAAIRLAMEICRKNPSQVGVHHFILVSDGEDYVADSTIVSWVPTLKASGVVLDYIHIGDHAVNAGLKEACKQLGGDAVTVNTERDFAVRFVEATQRRMLPAPAAV
jgi:hypothetical protein